VTVIFDNLGPYHQARLRAGASVSTLTAVQVSARSADYAWENQARPENFDLITLFPQGTSRGASARQVVDRTYAALTETRPEVVFIPGWSSRAALAALVWCLSYKVPVVIMSESTAWDEKRLKRKENVKRRIVRLCSAALVGGEPQAGYLVQLGMPADQVFLGYDAVDNDYFKQKAGIVRQEEAAVRVSHGLPENYFLASARFIEKKNLPRLLEAYARYRALCGRKGGEGAPGSVASPWGLVLLGDGVLRETLVSHITRLNLQSHVLLPGFKQYADLPTYYALAGAFIHASVVEQWGLVVNEAMASGLPVLVSNRCGCASDLVQQGQNGFTFDPDDVESVAGIMQRISNMETETREALGRESERIVAEWSPKRFADGLHHAASHALKADLPKATWMDRLLLRGLLLR
jgi:glycosyltransferase involved in cell wall biosynthesis